MLIWDGKCEYLKFGTPYGPLNDGDFMIVKGPDIKYMVKREYGWPDIKIYGDYSNAKKRLRIP